MALVLNGSLTQSIFLDPLVAPHRFEHGNGLLAYEIFGSVNGQYTPNSRLSPIRESVVGGLYSVRGYKQSIESGDSSVVGTVEFRLHIPRLFALDTADPDVQKPFSFTPRRPHVNPDWDLIVRPVIDAGYVYNNGSARTSSTDANGNTVANTYAGTYQEDHSHLLVGAGVGAELDVKQNLSVRVDYGIALKSVNAIQTVGANVVTRNDASAGSSVVSFSVLAAY
jgi:hemolysin activation/secretion protein